MAIDWDSALKKAKELDEDLEKYAHKSNESERQKIASEQSRQSAGGLNCLEQAQTFTSQVSYKKPEAGSPMSSSSNGFSLRGIISRKDPVDILWRTGMPMNGKCARFGSKPRDTGETLTALRTLTNMIP